MRPFAAFVFVLLGLIGAAQADGAETILVNGKVIVYDGSPAEALAISHGRIVAVGHSTDIRAHQGSTTRVVDLDGRTVIPGLVDSHIHAIRAGLTFNTEVHWIGVRSLAEALDRVRQKARNTPAGSWLVLPEGGPSGSSRRTACPRRPSSLRQRLGTLSMCNSSMVGSC